MEESREAFRKYIARLAGPSIGAVERGAAIPSGALYKFLRGERWISDKNIERLAVYFKVPFIEMWR